MGRGMRQESLHSYARLCGCQAAAEILVPLPKPSPCDANKGKAGTRKRVLATVGAALASATF